MGFPAGSTFGGLAIDGLGNIWMNTGSQLYELSNAGSFIGGYSTLSLGAAFGLAIDGAGSVWVPNVEHNNLLKFSQSGSVLGTYANGGLFNPYLSAIDSAGDVWTINSIQQGNSFGIDRVSKFSSSGITLAGNNGFVLPSLAQPSGIAIDGSGNVWISNANRTG